MALSTLECGDENGLIVFKEGKSKIAEENGEKATVLILRREGYLQGLPVVYGEYIQRQ